MRIATLCVAALLTCATGAFALAPTPSAVLHLDRIQAAKAARNVPGHGVPIYLGVAGDTIESAIPIPGIPFSASGNTCDYADDYNAVCPYSALGSPDVVYSFAPAANVAVDIDLCASAYDTKLYVFMDVVNNVIACNDDFCGSDGWKSQLTNVALLAGHTYYVVVDGYSLNDCGPYALNVAEFSPCTVTCPAGSFLEGEPVCQDGYYDSYNGGCNSVPPVFSSLSCSDVPRSVCGTYGGFFYAGLSYRDTDWYQIVLVDPAAITWRVRGETDTLLGIIDGNAGCPVTSFYNYTYGPACTDLSVTSSLSAGTWWLWVGSLNYGAAAGPCGQDYVATYSGFSCQPLAVEPTTWGQIKNMYK
ncbi:MAG: hypothetical protein U0167_11860 [bacterium]